MPQTIFFSWQADTSTTVGRNLIERALEVALARIGADTELEEAVRELEIDRDTKGVAGTPPIVDTIFKKIDVASVFLPDLTFVGTRLDGRPTPNPNVLIEYGWALKSLSHGFMVPVMNTAFGKPTAESMPFDMRHLRHPIKYCCPADADERTRKAARDDLSKQLEGAIRAILQERALQAPPPPAPPPFLRKETADRPGRFRKAGEPLGIKRHPFGSATEVFLSEDPTVWLRVLPQTDPGRKWSLGELEGVTGSNAIILPLNRSWRNLDFVRGADGFGVFAPCGEGEPTYGAAYIFKTGEIWSLDSFWSRNASKAGAKFLYLNESSISQALVQYNDLLQRLGLFPPFQWIAGIEGQRGRGLFMPRRRGYSYLGEGISGMCMCDHLVVEGCFLPDVDPVISLRPFFEAVYENFGLQRPQWLDTQRADD